METEVEKMKSNSFKDNFEQLETVDRQFYPRFPPGTRPLRRQSEFSQHRRSSDAKLVSWQPHGSRLCHANALLCEPPCEPSRLDSASVPDISAPSEMTKGPNCTLAFSRKESECTFCAVCKLQKPTPEKKNHLRCFETCLTFCIQDQEMMDERDPLVDSHIEGTEERLRELTKKWFLDTQVPLIVRNGLFPTWFLGFTTRKDAEKILSEKELGCFLIRLSNKSIGYILSYKGRDRCRHFLVNQSASGQFLVYGDTRVHDTVPDLIEYYKTSPIQPFGERLTTSCFEALSEELYDVIQVGPEEKPATAVINSVLERPPKWPPRSTRPPTEAAPPLPLQSRNLGGDLHSNQDGLLYAQLRKKTPKRTPYKCQKKNLEHKQGRPTTQGAKSKGKWYGHRPAAPQTVYSELGLLDSKSKSLPMLDCDQSCSPSTPPSGKPRPVSQVEGFERRWQPDSLDSCSSHSSSSRGSWENVSDRAVYYLAGRPGSSHAAFMSEAPRQQHEDSVYAEVTHIGACDSTQSLDGGDAYKPVEDVRPKHKRSSWVSKNEKWKWLFPKSDRK